MNEKGFFKLSSVPDDDDDDDGDDDDGDDDDEADITREYHFCIYLRALLPVLQARRFMYLSSRQLCMKKRTLLSVVLITAVLNLVLDASWC